MLRATLYLAEENYMLLIALLLVWLIYFFFLPPYFSVKDIERRKETSKSKVKDPEKTNASKPAPEGQIITHMTCVIFWK